jgi:zinc/manganese transport system substrate-binding protein
MIRKILPPLAAAVFACGALFNPVSAAPLRVVATFSVLGDLAKQVGGDAVAVTTLVEPGGDAHVYQPTPNDAKTIANADLVLVNGLGMEGWLDRLIGASGYKGEVVVVSRGVKPLTMIGDDGPEKGRKITDPHAWQNVANGQIYVRNIAAAFVKAAPAEAGAIEQRTQQFLKELADLDTWVKTETAHVPMSQRKIITSHDAFGYFGAAYGVTFLAPVGISTESEPTAADLGKLIKQIKKEHINALFIETMTDPRLIQQISRETGASVGPALFSDSLSPEDGPAPTYVKMFQNNVPAMVEAMLKNH